ncbi:hypothetical protein ACLX1H_007636 [Fusarium chlamydosporum]
MAKDVMDPRVLDLERKVETTEKNVLGLQKKDEEPDAKRQKKDGKKTQSRPPSPRNASTATGHVEKDCPKKAAERNDHIKAGLKMASDVMDPRLLDLERKVETSEKNALALHNKLANEKKEREKLLLKIEELEKKNKEKGEMIDELTNRITAIEELLEGRFNAVEQSDKDILCLENKLRDKKKEREKLLIQIKELEEEKKKKDGAIDYLEKRMAAIENFLTEIFKDDKEKED